MPPLLLLYGLTLIEKKHFFLKNSWILFFPFGCVLLLALFYKYQLVFNNKLSGYSVFLDQIPSWGEYVAMVYGSIVIFYLLYILYIYQKKTNFSLVERKPQLKWFKVILIVQLFSTLLWAASEIAFGGGYESSYYYPLWILLSIIIYWLGHVGIYKFGIQEERKSIRKVTDALTPISVEKSKNEHILYIEQFLVEEKNFLDASISLESLAEKMQLSKGYVSKIFNSEIGISFKEYLNKLRTEEAKSYLLNPDFHNYTLVAIGLEAGFSSKSSFNATFKKVTGLTPSAYKKKHSN